MKLFARVTLVITGYFALAAPFCDGAEAIPIEAPQRTTPVDFATEIAPIMRANCIACHHEKKASGSLILESPQSILKGGDQGPAVIAGKSTDSLLLKVAAHQVDSIMPPPENIVGAKPLTSSQLGLLKLWIDQGATGSGTITRDVKWQPLPTGYQPAMATAVTPDGQFAVVSRANRLLVYHLPSARLVTSLVDPDLTQSTKAQPSDPAHRDLVRCLAFNKSGTMLASGSFREVKLWRRPQVTQESEWTHEAPVQSVATSADGRWAATGDASGRIRIWEIHTGKATQSIPAHSAAVTGIVFSQDGAAILSGSLDKTIRTWNVNNGQQLGKVVETPSPIQGMTVVNNSEWVITGSPDGIARVWNVKSIRESNGETLKPLQEIKAHERAMTSLTSTSGDNHEFLTAAEDGLIRRWDALSGKPLGELRHEGAVIALAVSSDGNRMASAGPNRLTLWSKDGKIIKQIKGDPRLDLHIAKLDSEITFTKSAIALAQQDLKSYEGLIRINMVRKEDIKKAEDELTKAQKARDEKKVALEKVKTEGGKLEPAEKALADAETAVTVFMTVIERAKAISERTSKELADAEQAVKAREETLKQQDEAKAAALNDAAATKLSVRSLAFSTDNSRLAVGCDSGVVHWFDAESGSWSEAHENHQSAIHAICSTTNGKLVTGSADGRALLWNAPHQWRLERTIGGSNPAELLVDRVLSVDFSSDGQSLATAGGIPSRSGELKIWNVADGRLIRDLKDAHSETIFSVRFSSDGKQLASAGGDRFIKIFDVQSGTPLRRLAGHTGQVLTVSWKADGKMLISGSSDNTLKLWDTVNGLPLRTMKGTTYRIGAYKREVSAVSFIGESEEILAASGDGTVRLHRTTSDNDILTFSGSKGYLFSVAGTPDGRSVIASGSDGIARVWSGHEQQPRHVFVP